MALKVLVVSLWSLFHICTGLYEYTASALADEVNFNELPGGEQLAGNLPFRTFSGYIRVDGASSKSKHLHYWLVESELDPESDPVAFWTNGGPGCSGMLGMMTEHGPFQLTPSGALKLNPYAHNKETSLLFVEQPIGVGFSYSNEPADYNSSDASAALDNYNLIQGFMKRFPHLADNDLYITSESYGGHYMPTLALEILNKNSQAEGEPILNFKGLWVGNPYVDFYSGLGAMLDTFWARSLVAQPIWEKYLGACPRRWLEEPLYDGMAKKAEHACEKILDVLYDAAVYKTNVYAIDWPVCRDGSPINDDSDDAEDDETQNVAKHDHQNHRAQGARLLHTVHAAFKARRDERRRQLRDRELPHEDSPSLESLLVVEFSGAEDEGEEVKTTVVPQESLMRDNTRELYTSMEEPGATYAPCADWWMMEWFNTSAVKEALHVRADVDWLPCANSPFNFNETDPLTSVVTLYRDILMHDEGRHLKIIVYSGTDDSVCSTSGTQRWIYDLGFDVDDTLSWAPWSVEGQLAGFVTRFAEREFIFATVLNAGHEVPTYRPKEALALWRTYISGHWENFVHRV